MDAYFNIKPSNEIYQVFQIHELFPVSTGVFLVLISSLLETERMLTVCFMVDREIPNHLFHL